MIHISINERLEQEGKTAYWLAKEAEIHHTTLSQIRNNKNGAINLDYLERICLALRCQPGDVLQIVPEKGKRAAKK